MADSHEQKPGLETGQLGEGSHGFAGGFAPVFGEKWMKYSVEMIIWWK